MYCSNVTEVVVTAEHGILVFFLFIFYRPIYLFTYLFTYLFSYISTFLFYLLTYLFTFYEVALPYIVRTLNLLMTGDINH